MRILALIAFAGLAACTQTPAQTARAAAAEQATQEKLGRELTGLTPGRPTSCLPPGLLTGNSQLKGYGSTLLYRLNRNTVYRNDTTGGCEGVGARDDILVTVSPQGRTCQGDIATTVDRNARFQTGSCALGEFVPYRKQ